MTAGSVYLAAASIVPMTLPAKTPAPAARILAMHFALNFPRMRKTVAAVVMCAALDSALRVRAACRPTLPTEKSAQILLTTWITADIVTTNALPRIIIAEGNASNVISRMATGCAILQALASSIAATSRTIRKIAETVIISAVLNLA